MKTVLILSCAAFIFIVGLGLYVTDFTAYLGNNPATCNNCHVMDDVYEGWFHGSHRQWTTCNDCHTPHSLIPKYLVKAQSGYHHVSAFLLGNIPDAIRAKESSQKIVQDNCIRCHSETVDNLDWEMGYTKGEEPRQCSDCHSSTAHGKRGVTIQPFQNSETQK